MKKLLFSMLFLLSMNYTNSSDKLPTNINTTSIVGKVIDIETNETLTGVEINIYGENKIFYSDLDGTFYINNVEKGANAIVVDFISYEKRGINFNTNSDTLIFKMKKIK
jgi:hypothetical protein